MRTKYQPSPSRLFDKQDKAAIKAFYKKPCLFTLGELQSGKNQLPCREHESLRTPEYETFVEKFIDLINERDRNRTNPRKILRNLLENSMLPSCQMLYLYEYILSRQAIQEMEIKTKKYFELRQASVDQIEASQKIVSRLQKALSEEQKGAASLFKFPELNRDMLSIVQLIGACLNAVEEMKKLHVENHSLGRADKKSSVISKFWADLSLKHAHPGNKQASTPDLTALLPVISEAITGKTSTKNFLADSLNEEATRFHNKDSERKIEELLDGAREIWPGIGGPAPLTDKIREEMHPRAVKISRAASIIVTTAETCKMLLENPEPIR